MEHPSERLTGSKQSPPDSLRFVIRSDGSLDVERNCRQGKHVVLHLRPAMNPRSIVLAPTGSVVMNLLRKHLSRSPPPGPRKFTCFVERSRHIQEARLMVMETMDAMRLVEAMLSIAEKPAPRILFVAGYGAEIISTAARKIVQCLVLLQTETRPAPKTCLCCPLRAVYARSVPENTLILEMQSNHYCTTGYTTLDALSILPPIREFHPPMLCRKHQYEFQYLLYQVVCPTWPVPNLAADASRFGPVRMLGLLCSA